MLQSMKTLCTDFSYIYRIIDQRAKQHQLPRNKVFTSPLACSGLALMSQLCVELGDLRRIPVWHLIHSLLTIRLKKKNHITPLILLPCAMRAPRVAPSPPKKKNPNRSTSLPECSIEVNRESCGFANLPLMVPFVLAGWLGKNIKADVLASRWF